MSGMTLVEFLAARLDEDERAAREASVGGSAWPSSPHESAGPVVLHSRRHSPARVLVEVATKRRIVELHYAWDDDSGDHVCLNQCAVCDETSPCDTLRLLALPYAEHPDYREEGKP